MPQSANSLNKNIITALIASFIIVSDFLTKKLIVTKIMPYESIDVLPFLRIVHITNKGAAFGMFSGLGNTFFLVISFAAVGFIILYLSKLPKGIELYALSLILGGAIGNLIDRIMIGKVVDFIDVFVGTWHWPAFNVADSALTIGIFLFILANFRQTRR